MRTRKAERMQQRREPVRLLHRGSEVAQAIDDCKRGVPGAGRRLNELLGCGPRPGRKRPVIGAED